MKSKEGVLYYQEWSLGAKPLRYTPDRRLIQSGCVDCCYVVVCCMQSMNANMNANSSAERVTSWRRSYTESTSGDSETSPLMHSDSETAPLMHNDSGIPSSDD